MTPFPEMNAMNAMSALSDGNSRSMIWSYKTNGFGTFGWEHDHRTSCKFDFQGLIYLKVEHACLSTCSEIGFLGPNLHKSWNTYLHKSS